MTHAELVENLMKPGEKIVDTLVPAEADAAHMALGIAGEAGELVDMIKKMVIYGKIIPMKEVIEEMGDLEFYLEGLRQTLCITREEVLEANINKLQKRYSSGSYSDNQANARADKAEGASDIDSHDTIG